MKKIKQSKAITLIALVVTIVILLILSGVTINALIGENGLISYAKKAVNETEKSKEEEEKAMNDLIDQLVSGKDSNNININDLKLGWNLGNSLDCDYEGEELTVEEYETLWHNPITTKEMIAAIKANGFNTILIPVTWFNHVDSQNNINPEWMARVKEIVDYAIDCDMYVILNTHHDDDRIGLEKKDSEFEPYVEKYKKIWNQIANTFKNYPYNLIFEILNEPRAVINGEDVWSTTDPEIYGNLNILTDELVKTIRSTNEKNADRYILIPTYGTAISNDAFNNLEIPNDKHIAISVHGYISHSYCSDASTVFTEDIKEEIRYKMNLISEFMQENNITVIVTEAGVVEKSDKIDWVKTMYFYARYNRIPIILWDDGTKYTLFNRETLQIRDNEMLNTMKKTENIAEELENKANIIDSINYTENVDYNDINGISVEKQEGKNHYVVDSDLSSSVRFKFAENYNINNEGIYEFSCKIKTNMNDLDLKYVLNFYDDSGNLIYKKDYSSLTSNLVDGSKEEYEYKTIIFVENAYKVELERIHVSCKELKHINFEIYDLSLKSIEI